jgi:hypothetical protein
MKSMTRVFATVATAGLIAVGGSTAASAAPSDGASLGKSMVTCYGKANKPFIIGGVGNTSKQVGVVYCGGGGAYIRGSVTIQKLIGGYWYDQGRATVQTKFVGSRNMQFPDQHPAQPGTWRTKATFTFSGGGASRTFYSAQVRYVPARHGVTM